MVEAGQGQIEIEVVYALPHTQTVINLRVPAGTTIGEAIARSGIGALHPEIDLTSAAIGIFGKRRNAHTVLSDRDRIEIYRPLVADPKQTRRSRARRADPQRQAGKPR